MFAFSVSLSRTHIQKIQRNEIVSNENLFSRKRKHLSALWLYRDDFHGSWIFQRGISIGNFNSKTHTPNTFQRFSCWYFQRLNCFRWHNFIYSINKSTCVDIVCFNAQVSKLFMQQCKSICFEIMRCSRVARMFLIKNGLYCSCWIIITFGYTFGVYVSFLGNI